MTSVGSFLKQRPICAGRRIEIWISTFPEQHSCHLNISVLHCRVKSCMSFVFGGRIDKCARTKENLKYFKSVVLILNCQLQRCFATTRTWRSLTSAPASSRSVSSLVFLCSSSLKRCSSKINSCDSIDICSSL